MGEDAIEERSVILRRAFELMTARAEEFATLITLENGKALSDARAEVSYAAEFFRWYSEEAVRLAGTVQTAPSGDYRILVERAPIGVAVLVTPWNYPAAMATRKIGPALAAGCSVVLKPASDTPLTALAIGALLLEAGVPAGVVNVIPAHRSGTVVKTMLDQSAVRKLSFTGSTEVGRLLLRDAADRVISTSMELGGTRRSSSLRTRTSTRRSRGRWSRRCVTVGRPAPRRTGSTSTSRSPTNSVRGSRRPCAICGWGRDWTRTPGWGR